MTKKKLRYIFNEVINAASNMTCEKLHHKKSDRHKSDEICPVEYELHKNIHALREYMKEQGI